MQDLPRNLPLPVSAFIAATNQGNLEALLDQFATDALVNDQLREHWGEAAIRGWAVRDVFGERLTITLVRAIEHHGLFVVTAGIDGAFDKRGLPEPLISIFYFFCQGDKIVHLFILPGQVPG